MSRAEKVTILKNFLGYYHVEGGQQFLFRCPKCDHHKRKLSVNIEQNAFKCWICEYSGRNIAKLVQNYGQREDKSQWSALTNQVYIEDLSEKIFGEEEKVSIPVLLPEEYISLCNKKLPKTATYALNYLTERGVSKADILKWKIGYCHSGDFEGRLILPSFGPDGDLNFFVGRAYDGSWMKYRNSVASKDIIFNELFVDFGSEVILVEGVFDAIKAGRNSIPILGCSLRESSRLFTQIVKNNLVVYLALDADAEKQSMMIVSSLLKYDILVKKINIEPYADVGEMTKQEFSLRKKNAATIDSKNYLSNRILGI